MMMADGTGELCPERTDEQRVPALTRAPLVLLVEDDEELRSLLARVLRKDGYDVIEARNGGESMVHFENSEAHGGRSRPPDLLITDVRMPGIGGLELLAFLREGHTVTPVILITAFPDQELYDAAMSLGAQAVLSKPFDLEKLRAAVFEAVPPR